MTRNMFQEGLYHVYFKETPSPQTLAAATAQEELKDARIHSWFGTVVNIRLLVSGLLQVFGALACILTTVTHACVSYSCSVSMVTPVWSSLFYLATGCLTMEVQRKPSKLKVATLMGLNLFSVLLGFFALLAYCISSVHPIDLKTKPQRVGSHIAKGSSIAFTLQCLVASIYVLFVSWRGLRRYSGPNSQNYNRLAQDQGDGTRLLEEEEVFSL